MTLRKCITLKYLTKLNHHPYFTIPIALNFFFCIIVIGQRRITKQVSLLNNLNLNNYSFELVYSMMYENHTYMIFIYGTHV